MPIVKPNTETQSARPVRELLAHRPYWAWSVTAQLCRAPTLMAAMAFSGLTAATTGSSKAGGVLVSSLVLAEVAFAGVGGRLLDRSGGRAVPALAAAVSCSAMAAAAVLGARLPVLCVLSAVAGTALAGLPGLVRHRLNAAVPQRLLEPALSVDATVVELVVVGAPLIVSVVLLAGPAGGVVAMAVAAGLAAVLLALGRTGGHETGSDTSRPDGHGRLWAPGFVAWIAVSFAFGHALGAIETAALSLAETLRSGPFGGGAIIAVLALSSAAAGLGYAALARRLPGGLAPRAGLLLVLVAVATLAVGQAHSWLTLGVTVTLVGLGTAPLNTIRSFAVERLVPGKRRAEGFSWLYTASGLGFAASGLGLTWLPLWAALAVPSASSLISVVLLATTRTDGARR